MFKPSEPRERGRRASRAVTWLFGLVLPLGALAGLSSSDAPASAPSGPSLAPLLDGAKEARPAKGRYNLRCWQYGRLLFDETISALPAEGSSRYAGRLSAVDRAGRPLQVTELDGSTCLVRAAEERNWR
jgi:hypothetical protein